MSARHITIAILLLASSIALAQPATQTDIPTGKLTKLTFDQSEIFPGTTRDVWLYVPAQYTGDKPACIAAFCDGSAYIKPDRKNYVPAIFDKLIAAKEMPITIGVFANPGVIPAPRDNALPRYNRSYEYDGLGDDYARFLNDELFPFLAEKHDLKISKNPNHRMVAGASSGGICAFNCAWSRPDLFRRVWCTVGTFVGLRGGDELHSLVRKTEAKPLRIFLHDGDRDLNIYAGDWWMANQQMQRALEWMGYEHKFIWDEVGHGREGEMKYLTEAMRYLWKDWRKPIKTHPENAGERRGNFVVLDHPWEVVSKGHRNTKSIASNGKGEVFFSDLKNKCIQKIDLDGNTTQFANNMTVHGMAFSPDGDLMVADRDSEKLLALATNGESKTIATIGWANDLCVNEKGTIFFTSAKEKTISHLAKGSATVKKLDDLNAASGILLTPDQTQLFVNQSNSRMMTAYQLDNEDGVTHKQPYFWLHSPYRTANAAVGGMAVDTEGWVYVATRLGIQICDQAGRVNFIIPPPTGARFPADICFGGAEQDYLYATCGGRVFRRKLSKTGVHAWQAPVAPKKPRL